jgi:hypothetical protein
MSETATANLQPRRVGRPPTPFDKKVSKFNLNITNGLIRRFEAASPNWESTYTTFAELVIRRGLDAIQQEEFDQTQEPFFLDGSPEPPKTYNEYSQLLQP